MKFLGAVVACLLAFPVIAGTLGSVGLPVQASPVIERLHNVGGLIYDRFGNQVQLRGFNTDNDSINFEQIDAATVKAMGGNVIRWTPNWYADSKNTCTFPQTGDGYVPPGSGGTAANGYFNTTVLANTDAQVAAATARGMWIMIGFTTGGCDFATNGEAAWSNGANENTTVQGYYQAMLTFFANRYKNVPYIACYELWTEPRPITADSGSRYRNDIVAALEIQAIAAIRLADQVTPICIGPAAGYDVRANFNMTAPFNAVLGSNVWNMNDWYELGGNENGSWTGYTHQLKPITIGPGCSTSSPCQPPVQGANFTGSISGTPPTTLSITSSVTGAITIGTILHGSGVANATSIVSGSGSSWVVTPSQTVTNEAMFTGYTNYPAVYQDVSPSQTAGAGYPGCLYPPNNSSADLPVQMTGGNPNPPIVPGTATNFLAGLDDYCAVAWTNQTGVPVVMEQVGITTATPGAWQYDSDQLDMMNSRHQSYMIWVLRQNASSTSPIDGTNGGSSGGQGLFYQDSNPIWRIKDSTYACVPVDQRNQSYLMIESVSTCNDYYDMFSSKFRAAP